MPRLGQPDVRTTHTVELAAQVAAGLSLLMFWLNFPLAGLAAVIGLALAGLRARKGADQPIILYRWVVAICLVVLVAVAVRWCLSTPVEYLIDQRLRSGEPIP
ncbi:hypothetical protein GCM10027161_64620 [Microbispora hainanensis]